jgi:hypothetical protein
MGQHPDRNAQFENIGRLRQQYQAAGDPVISIDTKKKELSNIECIRNKKNEIPDARWG